MICRCTGLVVLGGHRAGWGAGGGVLAGVLAAQDRSARQTSYQSIDPSVKRPIRQAIGKFSTSASSGSGGSPGPLASGALAPHESS